MAGSFWEEQVLPRAVDLVLADPLVGDWRRATTAGLAGTVLELGFGTGRCLPVPPPDVHSVLAVEPSDAAWARAQHRVSRFPGRVARVGVDGAALPVDDNSADHALVTWSLCTIPDVGAALSEVCRVVRPGGRLHFVEHSLAPDPRVRRLQRRLQPVWGRVAGGCHLDRDIPRLLTDSGLQVEDIRAAYVTPIPAGHPFGWFCRGTARVT